MIVKKKKKSCCRAFFTSRCIAEILFVIAVDPFKKQRLIVVIKKIKTNKRLCRNVKLYSNDKHGFTSWADSTLSSVSCAQRVDCLYSVYLLFQPSTEITSPQWFHRFYLVVFRFLGAVMLPGTNEDLSLFCLLWYQQLCSVRFAAFFFFGGGLLLFRNTTFPIDFCFWFSARLHAEAESVY